MVRANAWGRFGRSIAATSFADCSIRIPAKLYVSPKQRRDLASVCRVYRRRLYRHGHEPRERRRRHGYQTSRQRIMAVISLDRDDNQTGAITKARSGPDQGPPTRNQCENIQNLPCPFVIAGPRACLARCSLGPYQRGMAAIDHPCQEKWFPFVFGPIWAFAENAVCLLRKAIQRQPLWAA